MKPIRIEAVVTIEEFKVDAAHMFHRIEENNQPVVITQNGSPVGVLLSPKEFDRLVERQRVVEEVTAGAADLDAGRTMTTGELKRRLGLGDDRSKR